MKSTPDRSTIAMVDVRNKYHSRRLAALGFEEVEDEVEEVDGPAAAAGANDLDVLEMQREHFTACRKAGRIRFAVIEIMLFDDMELTGILAMKSRSDISLCSDVLLI